MRFSKNWLLEYVDIDKSTEELSEQFTSAGLEVDFTEPAAPQFTGVVVAIIKEASPHPDAQKLQVCTVDNGNEELQIVCGAGNARPGIKVALATVGAVLPGDFKIKPAKLRGVESVGMLCAETELGLLDVSNGIMELPDDAPLGINLREYMQLDDDVIDIDLTANRGDCFSLRGLARELGVINEAEVKHPSFELKASTLDETIEVNVEDTVACPRYCSRIIKSINLSVQTPLWMQEALRRSGIRSINPVVDSCNYVMLAFGQPMHGFDLDKINQKINVRYAKQNEEILLLDDRVEKLDDKTLVIADAKQPLAIAGVMGGLNSAVTDTTKNILLESAYFSQQTIMGVARKYTAHTDSSHRFERGVDPMITVDAMEYATSLIVDICGGEVATINEQLAADELPKENVIILRAKQISRILGFDITEEKVIEILQRLGLIVSSVDGGWEIRTPSHRFDLQLEIDLIEELARIIGFDHIPSSPINDNLQMLPCTEVEDDINMLRQRLVDSGYYETMSYSFVDSKIQALVLPSDESIALINPISKEMDVMRSSVWTSLIMAVVKNQKYQIDRVRLFEVGRVYKMQKDKLSQPVKLTGVINGSRYPEQWGESQVDVDYYDAKKDVEKLLSGASFVRAKHESLHPGQSAEIFYKGQSVGWLGALHPRISQKLKITGSTMLFEIDFELVNKKNIYKYHGVNNNPSIRRDLAIVVQEHVAFAQVYDIVRNSTAQLLLDVNIFDLYQGAGIEPGYKSFAIKLVLQHHQRTLIEDEVTVILNKVIKELETTLGAKLRV